MGQPTDGRISSVLPDLMYLLAPPKGDWDYWLWVRLRNVAEEMTGLTGGDVAANEIQICGT
jgi:hypothetical protein